MRAACLAALVLAVTAAAASAAPERLVVDDDTVQCPHASFTSIAAAVAAAQPLDTVAVCPGRYAQAAPIVIDKPLTLWGSGADSVRIQPSADFAGSVIEAQGGGPVQIRGVTIAAGDPPAVAPAVGDPPVPAPFAVGGAVRFQDTSGWLQASRVTDLGVGSGVTVEATTPDNRSVQIEGTLIEGYAAYGVRFQTTGAELDGLVTDSVVRGRSVHGSSDIQDGVQVLGAAAEAHLVRNLITGNRNTADEVNGAGVRFQGADPASTVTRNDLQGNGYGVFWGEATGRCDGSGGPLVAEDNWWGDPAGATSEPRPLCPPVLPLTGSPAAGDRINTGVDAEPHATSPRGAPAAPAPQADGAPDVSITSPADGTAAEPGSPVTVTAAATDDFDVKKVEFRRGTTLVATDTAPPYSAAVTAPAAGASQVVTATAIDSSGQSAVAAISLRGTLPPEQPATPETPQAPAEPEDRPPTVALTGPAPGAQIDPAAAPRITADAADDRGVARVVFFDDGQQVCSDDTAPYDCAYAPNGGDVGRNTLIAIAVDGAGQGAVDFRGVEVRRFNPKLTARTTPGRDRRRPYRYTTSGSVLLPAGVTPAQACSGGGSVAIEFRVGKLRLPMTATLRSDCSFRTSIAFPSRRSLGNGRIAVTAKFGGNTVLGTAKAPSQKVRAG